MSEDINCECPDPRVGYEGKKLWLCGTSLCDHILRGLHHNGYALLEPYIISETEDNEEN